MVNVGDNATAVVAVMLTPEPGLPTLSHTDNRDKGLRFRGAKTDNPEWISRISDVPGITCPEAGGCPLDLPEHRFAQLGRGRCQASSFPVSPGMVLVSPRKEDGSGENRGWQSKLACCGDGAGLPAPEADRGVR